MRNHRAAAVVQEQACRALQEHCQLAMRRTRASIGSNGGIADVITAMQTHSASCSGAGSMVAGRYQALLVYLCGERAAHCGWWRHLGGAVCDAESPCGGRLCRRTHAGRLRNIADGNEVKRKASIGSNGGIADVITAMQKLTALLPAVQEWLRAASKPCCKIDAENIAAHCGWWRHHGGAVCDAESPCGHSAVQEQACWALCYIADLAMRKNAVIDWIERRHRRCDHGYADSHALLRAVQGISCGPLANLAGNCAEDAAAHCGVVAASRRCCLRCVSSRTCGGRCAGLQACIVLWNIADGNAENAHRLDRTAVSRM